MEGILINRKSSFSLVFIIGLVFLTVSVIDLIVNSHLNLYLIPGLLCLALDALPQLLRRRAYIHIDDHEIHARAVLSGNLHCTMDDIAFVLPQMQCMTILLKSGKRWFIGGIENSADLCAFIRKKTFSMEPGNQEELRQKWIRARKARKNGIYLFVGLVVLMFAVIFVAVLLTGGRDIPDFNRTDFIVLGIMGAVLLAVLIGVFYLSDRIGKAQLPIEYWKYRLRSAQILSEPLPSEYVRRVWTDDCYWKRVVLWDCPEQNGVRFCVQTFDTDCTLYNDEEMPYGLYESEEDIPMDLLFPDLMEITEYFR